MPCQWVWDFHNNLHMCATNNWPNLSIISKLLPFLKSQRLINELYIYWVLSGCKGKLTPILVPTPQDYLRLEVFTYDCASSTLTWASQLLQVSVGDCIASVFGSKS